MEPKDDVVIPVVAEELHADAIPVETGSVRIVKHVEGHDELVEQELRKGHVQVKRVKTNRVVDGPQAPQKTGNTLIVPVVSEVLRIERQWVVTEEIHITQVEELETVQQKVRVNAETVRVERLNAEGKVIEDIQPAAEPDAERDAPSTVRTLVDRTSAIGVSDTKPASLKPRSLLREKPAKL